MSSDVRSVQTFLVPLGSWPTTVSLSEDAEIIGVLPETTSDGNAVVAVLAPQVVPAFTPRFFRAVPHYMTVPTNVVRVIGLAAKPPVVAGYDPEPFVVFEVGTP